MNKINVIIIDDEPIAQDILEAYIKKIPELKLIAKCDNAIEANSFLRENNVDLMFLDIQMPEISGLNFLKTLANPPMTIFVTAYTEFALDGYDLSVLDYLLKPISFERFMKATQKALDRYELENKNVKKARKEEDSSIFIKDGYEQIKVYFNDILYCEGLKDYVQVFLSNGKNITTLSTMKNMESLLPKDEFIRTHRSYIVNRMKIERIQGNTFSINDKLIPIGKSYIEEVKKKVNF